MNTRKKILIDRIIGIPMVAALGVLARVSGAILRRDHSTSRTTVKRIVVAKFVGMGSILQACAMVHQLRGEYPDAVIIFLTSSSNKALIERLPFINKAIYIDESSAFRLLRSTSQALMELSRQRVDLYFDLEVYSAYAAMVALLSLARNRYGFYRSSGGYKKGIHTHLMYFNTRRPVRRVYMQLGRLAGVSGETYSEVPSLELLKDDYASLKGKLSEVQTRYLVINPNASDLMLERRWPAGKFAELIERLHQDGLQIFLVGGAKEVQYVARLHGMLSEATQSQVVNTAGLLKLNELFALLGGACCVVTNDTGPMHMAVSMKRPTVCLFGPVDPAHYGFNEEDFVETIYHPVYCSPCVHEVDEPPCGGNNVCMKQISVDEVYAATQRLLSNPHDKSRCGSSQIRYSDQHGRPLGMVVNSSVVPQGGD